MSTKLFFRFFFLIDLPFLSKMSILCIILTIVDYFLPVLNSLMASKQWSAKDQSDFDNSCESIAKLKCTIAKGYSILVELKQENRKVYYSSLLVSLLVFAWLSGQIRSEFLTFIVTLLAVLFPGMSHHSVFKKLEPHFAALVSILPSSTKKPAKKEK